MRLALAPVTVKDALDAQLASSLVRSPLEEEVNEEFYGRLRSLPWVLRLLAGEVTDTSDVSTPEFLNGLILLLGAVHDNNLRLARELDALRRDT